MPLPEDRDLRRAQLYAGGGAGGSTPRTPMLPGEWRPGMPCHWTELTRFAKWKHNVHRALSLLHLAAGVAYVQYRARKTIAVFTTHPALVAYQVFFLVLEALSVVAIAFKTVETWRVVRRNSVDFKRIPNNLIATTFAFGRRRRVRSQHSNWPSVGVFIPCYNEDVDLVRQTVVAALAIDYPHELLTVYLCDDGKDHRKVDMISGLREEHTNLHYVIRPDSQHAKAGNLNYALERTRSDLIVTLDADFIARPRLLQRLVPYYYNWNPKTSLYEFNDSLACVQTPQHFRNLSPYDSDPLDQRATLFFDVVLPGKDWFNGSTMIGTTNLLSRIPAMEVGFYPYHSVTEDSAMSLAFHSSSYRTYYVNESLAHGLACTSLWSNLGQRARWLKGDWQILFNLRKGPLFCKGLSVLQRTMYLHMSFTRVISIIHLVYELALILLLVFSVSPLDAADPKMFIYHIAAYLVLGIITRQVLVLGGAGLDKSESGSVAFEAVFRYHVITGLVVAAFKGENIKFKVTDKASGVGGGGGSGEQGMKGSASSGEPEAERFDEDSNFTILGQAAPRAPRQGIVSSRRASNAARSAEPVDVFIDERSPSPSGSSRDVTSSNTSSPGLAPARTTVGGLASEFSTKPRRTAYFGRPPADRAVRRSDIRRNLPKVWFNVLMMAGLVFAIVWAVLHPPAPRTESFVAVGGVDYRVQFASVLPVAMAMGFAGMSILPHFMALFLALRPYTSGWMMPDFVHGRCDQYAVHPKTGKLVVPWSYITLLTVAKGTLMLASIGVLAYFIYGPEQGLILVPASGTA